MYRLSLALLMILLTAGFAGAHGNISKLPDSVQIMQYKMKLYMNENDAETKNKLAMVYVRTGRLDEAVEQLDAILKRDAHNFNALDEMGVILVIKGEAEKALDYLKKAREINDHDMMLHVHLSVALDQMGQSEAASVEMDKARGMAKGAEDLKAIEKEARFLVTPPKTGGDQ